MCELTSKRQKVLRLPTEPPGRPVCVFPCTKFVEGKRSSEARLGRHVDGDYGQHAGGGGGCHYLTNGIQKKTPRAPRKVLKKAPQSPRGDG